MVRLRAEAPIVNNGCTQVGQAFRTDKSGNRQAVFECACGNRFVTTIYLIKDGRTKSCGCWNSAVASAQHTTHGMSKNNRTYVSWSKMLQRCRGTSDDVHRLHYSDRGITVCERWEKFENFVEDMGERPVGMTLDREDNDGDYCKENCRWATHSQQMRNKRTNVLVPVDGVMMTLIDAAEATGIKYDTLKQRLRHGWTPLEATTTPVR